MSNGRQHKEQAFPVNHPGYSGPRVLGVLGRSWPASVLAWLAYVWWGGVVDAVDLARRCGLNGAARLPEGPVARGKQGLVWRLDTAEGSWAVKAPFHQSGEDEVRSAAAFQQAACAAGVPAPKVRRTTEGWPAGLRDELVALESWIESRDTSGLSPRPVGR